jgi:hypothetical protein
LITPAFKNYFKVGDAYPDSGVRTGKAPFPHLSSSVLTQFGRQGVMVSIQNIGALLVSRTYLGSLDFESDDFM